MTWRVVKLRVIWLGWMFLCPDRWCINLPALMEVGRFCVVTLGRAPRNIGAGLKLMCCDCSKGSCDCSCCAISCSRPACLLDLLRDWADKRLDHINREIDNPTQNNQAGGQLCADLHVVN
jgi:hypothetical protein